jgi:hypothetical protein
MNISVFWDITPCTPLKIDGCFGGIFRLHIQGLQGPRISQEINQHEARNKLSLLETVRIFDYFVNNYKM